MNRKRRTIWSVAFLGRTRWICRIRIRWNYKRNGTAKMVVWVDTSGRGYACPHTFHVREPTGPVAHEPTNRSHHSRSFSGLTRTNHRKPVLPFFVVLRKRVHACTIARINNTSVTATRWFRNEAAKIVPDASRGIGGKLKVGFMPIVARTYESNVVRAQTIFYLLSFPFFFFLFANC